jgi:hypothetical protein
MFLNHRSGGACVIQWTLVFIEIVWRSGPRIKKCITAMADADSDDVAKRDQLGAGRPLKYEKPLAGKAGRRWTGK